MSCYRYQQINYKEGLLDNIIDATYVIHLKGNGRYEALMNGLNNYYPSSKVYVLFNKGFKKCKKDLPVQNSAYDLVHANLEIFKHANSMGYQNILILEDDFIFSDLIKKRKTIKNLERFFSLHSGESFVYYLGTAPLILIPYDENNYYAYLTTGNHACIYTPKVRKDILDDKKNIGDWEVYIKLNNNKYTYFTPLCFQTFPLTENQTNWPSFCGLTYIYIKILKAFGMDKYVEPGHSIFNCVAKSWVYSLIFIIVVLVVYLMSVYHK